MAEEAIERNSAFNVGTHDDLVRALRLAVLDDHIKEGELKPLVSFA